MQSLKVCFLIAGVVIYIVFTIYTYNVVQYAKIKSTKPFLTKVDLFTYVSSAPNRNKEQEKEVTVESKKESVVLSSVDQFSFLDSINQIRTAAGLQSIKTDQYSCTLANQRASEITTNFSHEGFEKRKNEQGFAYPRFTSVVENIAMSSDNNPVEMWMSSPTHKSNLLSDITYGCVGQSGSYYVFEGWKE